MVKDDRVCSAARRDSNKLLACGLRDARQRIYGHFLIKQMETGNTQTVSFRTFGMNTLYISLGEY